MRWCSRKDKRRVRKDAACQARCAWLERVMRDGEEWFAWFPVQLNDTYCDSARRVRKVVWMEQVWRRGYRDSLFNAFHWHYFDAQPPPVRQFSINRARKQISGAGPND